MSNLKLTSGLVFAEPSDTVTTAKLNRQFEDGFVTITSPITIGQGGTGADNAKEARDNLGIASIKSIKGFGAKGDGVTDDTTAIQAALDDIDNDALYVPAGTYLFSSSLIVPSNTYMFGAGMGVAIFKNTNTSGADGFTLNGTGSDIESGTPITDVVFNDFAVLGNSLSGDDVSGNILERFCMIRVKLDSNGANGVNIGADNNTVNNKFGGIYLLKCFFNGNTDAIALSGGMQITIDGCLIEEYTDRAIVLIDCWSATIVENRGISTLGATTNVIDIDSSTLNNANVRKIRSIHIRNNIWEDIRTGQDFIHIETQGTTENCGSSAIGNMADKLSGDFDFIDLSGVIKNFRIDSNAIQSDASASAVGITIGTDGDATWIGGGNCFENGINIVDNGTNTTNIPEGQSYIRMHDQKAQGTDGGTSVASAFTVRDLNTIAVDTTGKVTLVANEFTLPPGTYSYKIITPVHQVGNHRVRLFNVTDSTQEDISSSQRDQTGHGGHNTFFGRLVVPSTKTYRLEYFCSISFSQGLGVATNIAGEPERYAVIELRI